MEELRIDLAEATQEDRDVMAREAQQLFRLNHSLPCTEEYTDNLNKLFKDVGKNFTLQTPLQGVRFNNVRIGDNVSVMSNCLMMSAGGIMLEDNVLIAANVQLISNNHDLEKRSIITCKPVHIKKNCWIGAGSTILPGVTVGENSVVGAGAVVTKDVPDNVIVVGNPAKIIRDGIAGQHSEHA